MKRLSLSLRVLSAVLLGGLGWLGGCSASSKEGVTLVVEAEGPRSHALTTTSGTEVTLTRGYLNTGAVEILSCATAGRWLDFWRMPVARAHVTGSPTLLGTPLVESLVADDLAPTKKIGELHPPPGAYCRVKHTILAADPDAPGRPADGSMLGRSLLLGGTYAKAGAAPRPFVLSSTASFDVETTFDMLALSVEGRRAATIVLTIADGAWFEGVDLDGDPTDAATRVLENLRALLGARIE